MKRKFTEGIHYYFNEHGNMVLTAHYHLENGSCCGNGCLNCPYEYVNVPEPRRSSLQEARALRHEKEVSPVDGSESGGEA